MDTRHYLLIFKPKLTLGLLVMTVFGEKGEVGGFKADWKKKSKK